MKSVVCNAHHKHLDSRNTIYAIRHTKIVPNHRLNADLRERRQ